MANLTTVGLTAGAGSSGTGTVSTLDNVIGAAGTANTNVQTVQGIASMTPLKVDGSGVTQPVSVASLPSQAVTNAGTFAVQVTSAPTTAVTLATAPTTPVTGTFWQTTQPVSAAALPLPTGAATSALQPTAATQGSTTSGQTGHLVQGAVTTASPTYTTAQTSPLSLDTTGALRVNVTAGGAGGGVVTQSSGANLRVQLNDGTTSVPILAASSGAPAATVPAIPVSLRDVNPNGRTTPANSAPVVLNSMIYKAVAASATATLLGTSGASGDYLDGVLIVPATAAAGAVSITDGSGSAITIFAGGGTTALPTLAPFFVPIGAVSSGGTGGWKVTTGTNVSVIGVGNFT